MLGMFEKCENLISLNINYFYTKNLKEASYFVSNCKKLEQIDLFQFYTDKLVQYDNMFENLPSNTRFICKKEVFKIQSYNEKCD